MADQAYFQSIIMALQKYWAEKGCLIWQPYYTQVGAGTMNPATFLRVLGPEPWNVAYVEPSIRPDDGRYGDNPYRLQQHYQFQVILKPDPGNPQEIYLDSLRAIGVNPEEHDIRFVEDNWESPALGAWGLGWEVWLDGQEITQYTYFQQAGGVNLDPVSVELTYGLERITMALQKNYHFRNINWNEDFTYGDVNYMAEKEHSTYYFDEADIEQVRQMYALFEKEADMALKKGLVLPAHDYILKCSHTFNILDTRGAVGVTERQALFGRMRDLSRRSAEAYIAQREALGFPWLKKNVKLEGAVGRPGQEELSLPPSEKLPAEAPFVLEIGTEELPASDLQSAVRQLEEDASGMFSDLRLGYRDLKILGTPRRLAVVVEGLASRQEDQVSRVKGPPADRAFDGQGNPTKAVEGFARSRGVEVADLKREKVDGGEYLVAEVHEEGRSVFDVLPGMLEELAASIRFDKSMRWNASGVAFSRPVRWLTALFGEHIIPFRYAGLQSGRATRGLRFSKSAEKDLVGAKDYLSFLEKEGILADMNHRREAIRGQVMKLLESVNASPELDEGLLDEVANLVEAPTALLGSFDPRHLELPDEVLIGVMKKHQRYFPVKDRDGHLMPYFITVRNGGKEHLDIVARGNEEVIGARFDDAAFFMLEDSEQVLDDFIPKLDKLTFHPKLGSMLDKTERIMKLTEWLGDEIGLLKDEKTAALEAARLCKADLATKMVVEMTSLQGIIGSIYAEHAGKEPAVSRAIREHYEPRTAAGQLPDSKPGLVVGLADRLDSLAGLFAAGMAPTGTRDPFGLRRAAIGLSQNLIAHNVDLDLQEALGKAADALPVKMFVGDRAACLEFIQGRLENLLLEEGFRYDAVNAVLAEAGENPALAALNIRELSGWIARKDWDEILTAYSRCVRITRDLEERFEVDRKKLALDAEKHLFDAYQKVRDEVKGSRSVDIFLDSFMWMIPAVNQFFDDVLVMDEDLSIRRNRLALLQDISALADGRADFSELEGF